jgi:SAM-dependent methyltransferase
MAKKRNEQNSEETVTELAAFTGKNRDEVEQLLATSTGKLAADWNSRRPESREEVEGWYRENSESYIYDLAQYHLAYKHIVFTLDVMSLAQGRVLDYGAGIGDLALALAESGREVTYFDVEGKSKKYARWQAERRKLNLTFASSDDELQGKKFDTIIVLDVLEHLFEPEKTLDLLLSKLAEGGTLIVSAYFGATKAHPMHFDHKLDVAGLLASRGLSNAKGISLRLFGSEAMRRHQMLIYHTVV